MADHSELVAEMAHIEKTSTQDRLKLARRRRMQQLKKWSQREKEYNSGKKKKELNLAKKSRKNDYKVHFVSSVMLLEAAARNDIEEVRRLLMLGVSPDSTNEDGLTALHQCCIDDSEDMMKLLIEFGANVNAKDSEQWTPLHAAATCGHLHIVKYLISKGADLLSVNADGNMPYDICEDDGTLDYIENEMAKRGVTQEMIDQTRAATENQMLKDLKEYVINGNSLDFQDENGATPLHIAAANGYISVIKFLLEKHVKIDACDNDQWQPIHAAACWGHPDAIELLVQAGANINAKTKNGETPYDISEDPEVRERLIQLKFEMETKLGSQNNRLRRSHSQNTRSQSIRRTSIREKVQISRREAREEARFRQEKEEHVKIGDEDEVKQNLDMSEKEISKLVGLDIRDIDVQFLPIDGKDTLQRFKGKVTCDALEEKEKLRKTNFTKVGGVPNNENHKGNSSDKILTGAINNQTFDRTSSEKNSGSAKPTNISYSGNIAQTSESTSIIQQNSGQSVNVEIHVTVNTSPTCAANQGTLSDLKKHRCNERHRNSISSNSSQQELNGKTSSQNGHYLTSPCNYNNPPSPSISPRKYVGDPLEVIGGKKRKKGCCSIM